MDRVQKGKHIVSAAKSLKRFQIGDTTIAAFLYATSHAGRAGLLASAIRHNRNISLDRLISLAAEEGFSYPDLVNYLIPIH